jgi:uncharacterized protein (TIGR03089 family)
VTFYDDASGERAELSAASLGNWIAKTHFLLTDELGLGVGSTAHLRLPLHWLDLVVLFGGWSAGVEFVDSPDGADVAFTTADGVEACAGANEVFALALRPWGQGFPGRPPPGSQDFVAAVRPQPDAWGSVRYAAGATDPAYLGITRAALVERARARASDLGLGSGARLLVTDPAPGPLDVATLLAPLSVGGTLVLVRHATSALAGRIAQEKVTATV